MSRILLIGALGLLLAGCAESFEGDQETEDVSRAPSAVSGVRGTPAAGRQVADKWCVNCHVTSRDIAAASDIAPTWASIAADPEKTDAYLRSFLTNPHGEMQSISLSRQQIADVVSYIGTLR